jgi:hypothetical protein
MKRLIVAVAIALSSAPVLADAGAPFEQNELDRVLPNVPQSVAAPEPIARENMPFEQSQLDRGSVGIAEPVLLASVGGTSYKSDEDGGSPWSGDHNFIAPAQ